MDDPCMHSPITCVQPAVNWTTFKSAMVVVAHPDDESSAGGTIAKFINVGIPVHFVWITKGEKGTGNRSLTPIDVAFTRRNEAINAAKVFVGVTTTDFLLENDGELQNTMDVREKLVFLYRKYQPDVVLTFNPTHYFETYRFGTQHHDHRTAGEIALDCAYPLARDFLPFNDQIRAGMSTWNVKEVWLFSYHYNREEPQSNIWIDITDTIQTKINSLLQHRSQYSDPSVVANDVRNTGRKLGAVVGVQYAEWFTRVVEMS